MDKTVTHSRVATGGNVFSRLAGRVSSNPYLIAVRKGLTLMVPLMTIGAFVLFLKNFPLPAYQEFVHRVFGDSWDVLMNNIYQGTFSIMSAGMLLCIAYCIADGYKREKELFIQPAIASIVALGCYFIMITQYDGMIKLETVGTLGVFMSIFTALLSSFLFCNLYKIKRLHIRLTNNAADPAFEQAFASIIPAMLTLTLFAVIRMILSSLGVNDIHQGMYAWLKSVFQALPESTFTSILYVFMVHFLWFFGIHGANVLEPLVETIFTPALNINAGAVAAGGQATMIFTKEFFDAFVMMGGAGVTLSMAVALIIRKKRTPHRKLGIFSLITGAINVNEVMLFGLPIVFNIYLMIPFILLPVILTLTTATLMSLGIVPLTIHAVEWTTPVLLSGYMATGSIAGSVMQLLNIGIGVAVYMPFINQYEKQITQQNRKAMDRLFDTIEEIQKQPRYLLRSRNDDIGNLARAITNDLKEAMLQPDELYLELQPISNIDGEITSAECLLRWNHKQYGLIPAPVIVALAEDCGKTNELGEWVMRGACDIQKELREHGIDISLSLNITPSHLADLAMPERFALYLRERNIDPSSMVVEITEETALESSVENLKVLSRLKGMGVKLAMDDFGMGHSSLKYLEDFSLDIIKIDGSIVRSVLSKQSSREIISSIAYLCKSMSMQMVAEYVESMEVKDTLESLGCNYFQGYFNSQPLTVEDFIYYYRSKEIIYKSNAAMG